MASRSRSSSTVEPWSADFGPVWSRFPIARLRHSPTHTAWTLFWRDRHLQWRYPGRYRVGLPRHASHLGRVTSVGRAEGGADPYGFSQWTTPGRRARTSPTLPCQLPLKW